MPENKTISEDIPRNTQARHLFEEFSKKNKALIEEKDDSKKENIKNEIKELDKAIISFLNKDIPASVSQDNLIEWAAHAFVDFHQFSPFHKDNLKMQNAFISIIEKKDFLDRLILGKGSEGYDEKSKQHQKQIEKGKQFVLDVFSSGAPDDKKFKDHLGKIRLHLDTYLSSVSHFNESEHAAIAEIHHAELEIEREKWAELRRYLNTVSQGEGKGTIVTMLADYTARYNTVGFLLSKTTAPLPDFITQKDILTLMILDPDRLMKNFLTNYSLLTRIGDIAEFKNQLHIEMLTLTALGVKFIDRDIDKALVALEEAVLQRQQVAENYSHLLNESLPLLTEIKALVKVWDAKNHYQLQNAHIDAINANTATLNLSDLEKREFDYYLAKVKHGEATHVDKDMPTLKLETNKILDKLQSPLTKLKEMEIYIKSQLEENKKNKVENSPSLLQAYADIHNQIKDIEISREKIASLKAHEGMKIVALDSIKNNNGQNEKMILYSILMTRKSILEGKPNREYLNLLYMNDKLNYYLHHNAPGGLKEQIKLLDKELIKETAQQLKTASREALIKTDPHYFTIDPVTKKPLKQAPPDPQPPYQDHMNTYSNEIKRQIESCTDHWSRKKINSFWIKVMEEAYKNNDQFTLNIVRNAVESQIDGAYFRSSKQRLDSLAKYWGSNDASQMNFLESATEAINRNNYDFIPDPAVFTSHAVKMQQAVANNQPASDFTLNTLRQFENNHHYLQNNYVAILDASLSVKPSLDFQKHAIRMTLLDNNESMAEKLIEYLKLIKSGWDELKVDDKVHNKNAIVAPRALIEHTIDALERNNSFSNIKTNLKLLQQNLVLSVDTPKAFSLFRMRFSKDDYSDKQMLQIKEDTNAILQMHDSIKAYIEKEKRSALFELETPENKNVIPDPLNASRQDDTNREYLPFKTILVDYPDDKHDGDEATLDNDTIPTSHAVNPDITQTLPEIDPVAHPLPSMIDDYLASTSLKSAPLPTILPIDIKEDPEEQFPLTSEWIRIESSAKVHQASAQALILPDQAVPQIMPREYKHNATQAHIRESKENDLIKVDVSHEPAGYESKSSVEKTNLDFILADSIINLLLNRCGKSDTYPIEILDSTNLNRMCALILVCEERGLNYKLANETHPVLADQTVLKNKLAVTRAEIEKSRSLPAVTKEAVQEPHRMHR